MIPFDFITEWRHHAPWVQDVQVEQDLIISRALVEMFNQPEVADTMAFRGGTALFKLYITPVARFSEDIDLVQTAAGPIGPALDAIRRALDPWLGRPRRTFKEGGITLGYRMQSEASPPLPMRLKIEINSREHFSVFGLVGLSFRVQSRWFSGNTTIQTYQLDELLGTKLRALYQRKKGRDLFDLWIAGLRTTVDATRVIECFLHYLDRENLQISRAEFDENLSRKLSDPRFLDDITPLIAPHCPWNVGDAGRYVHEELLACLPGDAWKG